MSKADQLGSGRFGGSARPVSARRAAIGTATGVPTEGVAPPTRLPVSRISTNPDNPRSALGDLTELAGSLQEHGQKQAITVMNRDAYIKANPEREGDLEPNTTHVVVDGSSRLAAAREAGLTDLGVMVDDAQGSDGEAILESALVANIHRKDLDPLDEARALQRLLALHVSQVKLAKRLKKSQGWVSQRLALLNLTPELQAVVGEEPVELLRAVAKEPQDRQGTALEQLKAERARKEAERQASAVVPTGVAKPKDAAGPRSTVESAVSEVSGTQAVVPSARMDEAESRPTPVLSTPVTQVEDAQLTGATTRRGSGESAEAVAVPRSDSVSVPEPDLAKAGVSPARQLPYHDGMFIARHLIHKMSDSEFDRMMDILVKHREERAES